MSKKLGLNETLLKMHDIIVMHHFSDNEYAKEVEVPAGKYLVSHKHKFSHLSILAQGTAIVEVDGVSRWMEGPRCINIQAGKAHKIIAITDIVWFCIHATKETDIDKIDGEVIE